jgi:hypothetical protein
MAKEGNIAKPLCSASVPAAKPGFAPRGYALVMLLTLRTLIAPSPASP